MKKRSLPSFKVLAVAVATASAGLSLTAFGEEEAQAAPDPQQVQRYLADLEAQQAAPTQEEEKRQGRGTQIRKMVEGAAVRAPSGSVINGIEAALAEKLG